VPHSSAVQCTQTPLISVTNLPWSRGTLFITPDSSSVNNTRWSNFLYLTFMRHSH